MYHRLYDKPRYRDKRKTAARCDNVIPHCLPLQKVRAQRMEERGRMFQPPVAFDPKAPIHPIQSNLRFAYI
jgi:hypothetical protein